MKVKCFVGVMIAAGVIAANAQAHYTPHTRCTVDAFVKWVGPWHAQQLIKEGWECDPFPTTITADDTDHTFVCRVKDSNEQPTSVTVDEVMTWLNAGYVAAFAHAGNVEGDNNVGTYHLTCDPGTPTSQYTDVTGSKYDSPNTPYANQIVDS